MKHIERYVNEVKALNEQLAGVGSELQQLDARERELQESTDVEHVDRAIAELEKLSRERQKLLLKRKALVARRDKLMHEALEQHIAFLRSEYGRLQREHDEIVERVCELVQKEIVNKLRIHPEDLRILLCNFVLANAETRFKCENPRVWPLNEASALAQERSVLENDRDGRARVSWFQTTFGCVPGEPVG